MVQSLAEAIEWMFEKVDRLELEDKDIFIPLGPSRTGKGTLLAAIMGKKMKIFRKNKVKQTKAGQEAKLQTFMAPVDPADPNLPDVNDIVSHQHNSHTIYPKIPTDKAHESFTGMENTFLVDFPGMFDCKGLLLDIPMEMAL